MDIAVSQSLVAVAEYADNSSVEIAFGGWGRPDLPKDFRDIKDCFTSLSKTDPIPSWLFEMVDILMEYKSLAVTEYLTYRKWHLVDSLPLV